MRDLHYPGRSPVHATNGMAATSHPLASETAIDVLKRGGNALDAAVAACAVQCVVEPESTGIGGDCFCLYSRRGSTDLVAYNGSGQAPAAATLDWYRGQGMVEIARQSPHAVTVPGAVDAWARLVEEHGTLPLAALLQPAIRLARDGYPIASRVAFDIASEAPLLREGGNGARVFLNDGKPPAVGALQRQPLLAATLETIARDGRDGFYRGPVAQDIVGYLRGLGGLHTMDDFAAARGEYVRPITTGFRGHRVYQCPPNGHGVIALLLLNVMSEEETGANPITAERLHREIEAGRLAYRDRALYVGDPNFGDVPVDWLLSQDHAQALRAEMNGERPAAPSRFSAPLHPSTVYICVVDADRNACSFINSLFSGFGTGLMAPKSGVMLHNRGQGFSLEEGLPNAIAPGKRPLHTIIPGMVAREDRVVMPFGVMGGQYQAFGHMQFLTRYFDYGCDIQEAIDLPRLFPLANSRDVQAESSMPAEVVAGLRAKGHSVVPPPKPIGGAQAIWIDWEQGVLTGGSDPRKDGCALGY